MDNHSSRPGDHRRYPAILVWLQHNETTKLFLGHELQMDFVDIEEMVGFNLPEAYKKLIENFPNHFRKVCGTTLLYESLDELYEANRIVQAADYGEQLTDADSWPDYHFVIGASGCGDWYVLVTNDDELEERVVFWDHETGKFSECWPTLYNCLDSHYEFFHTEGEAG